MKYIVGYKVESSTTTQACEEEGRQDETTVTNHDHLPEARVEFSALTALHQKLLATKLMFTPEKLELSVVWD